MSFLPMSSTSGDRIFISAVSFIAIHLLWMRFLEQYLNLLVGTAIGIVLAFVIVKWG